MSTAAYRRKQQNELIPTGLVWRKSKVSGSHNGDCLEVAFATGSTLIRDSKNASEQALSLSAHGWHGLLMTAKSAY